MEKFDIICEEYTKFYNSLLKKGRLPLGSTEIGFWGYADAETLLSFFKAINLSKFRSFADLGSGDGKVTLIASLFSEKAYGIEFDTDLYNKGVEIMEKLSLNNASFVKGDFLKEDLSKYEVLFINPDRHISKYLEKKLLKEMKGYLVVYGINFHPVQLKKVKHYRINEELITVYK